MQFVLPIDPADIRALPVDLAALEAIIKMSAGAISTVETDRLCEQMDASATFSALVAVEVTLSISHELSELLGLAQARRGLHFVPAEQ